MDLAEEKGLKFIGELTPRNLRTNTRYRKDLLHETQFEMEFDRKLYTAAINRSDEYVTLVNFVGAELLLPDAEFVVMRKDLRKMIRSFVYFYMKTLRLSETLDTNMTGLKLAISQVLDLTKGITNYLIETPDKRIVWYEDYFPDVDTDHDLSDNLTFIVNAKLNSYKHVQDDLNYLIELRA